LAHRTNEDIAVIRQLGVTPTPEQVKSKVIWIDFSLHLKKKKNDVK
jgi:hypothetical protein